MTASHDITSFAASIWDSNSGQLLIPLYKGYLSSAMFSPDGRYLITTHYDEPIRIWLAPSSLDEMTQQAKAFLPPYRNPAGGGEALPGYRLTCREREQFFLAELPRCQMFHSS